MLKLLGPDGQPLDTNALRNELARQNTDPQTAHVAQIWREFENHPGRGLTPAKLRALLVNGERGDLGVQADLADDMEEGDAHLFAELDKRRGAVTRLEWSIEPPKDASAAEKSLAAEVAEWFDELDVETVLADATDAILKGFAAQELFWNVHERVMLPSFVARPQRWFTVDGTRETLLLRNPAADPGQANSASQHVNHAALPAPTVNGEPLRPMSWWVHRHRAKSGYVARGGLLRVLAWPYLYKAYAQRDFGEFLEIYGLPLRIGKYPTGASDQEKMALLQAVTSLGHNAAGIIPMGMALEFQNAAQGQRDPFLAMLQYCDAAESKALLGQTLSASEGQNGTQALGTVHNEVRHDIRDADCRQIGRSMRELIERMVRVNKGDLPGVRRPSFELDTGDAEDLKAYAEHLPALAKSGMRIAVDWVHEKLRIPVAKAGEEVLSGGEPPVPPGTPPGGTLPPGAPAAPAAPGVPPAPKPPAAPAAPAPGGNKAALAGRTDEPPQKWPDLVDDMLAEQLADWQPMLGPLVQPLMADIEQAIAAGESLQSWRARLPQLVSRLDGGPVTEQLARAAFATRLAGEADLDLTQEQGD